MNSLSTLGGKLKEIEGLLDKTPAYMAKIGGCSIATYYRYRNGTSVPDSKFLNNILRNEKSINAEWLLKGNGPALLGIQQTNTAQFNHSLQNFEFTILPIYRMKQTGPKSEGALPADIWDNTTEFLPVCNMFIETIIGADPESMFVVMVNCDSMKPDINPGCMVVADKQAANPISDGIYFVQYDDVIRMKLLQKLPGNRLHLSTINKKYKPIELNLNESKEIKILGQIIWVGSPV